MIKLIITTVAGCLCAAAGFAKDRPIALMGYTTDVRGIEAEVMKPGRYVYETFCDKWIDPADYGKYAAIYVGEKIDGAAKGKNWRENGPSRDALAKYLASGGTSASADGMAEQEEPRSPARADRPSDESDRPHESELLESRKEARLCR